MKEWLDSRIFHILEALIKGMMLLFVFGSLYFSYSYFIDGGKEADFKLIQAKLKSFPELKVLKVGSKNDPIVLTNIFATLQILPDKTLTLSGLRPKTFEELNSEKVMRVGDWGIATLNINPKDPESDLKYRHGFKITRDQDFLEFSKKARFDKFDDLIFGYKDLEDFVLSLPTLDKGQISKEFFNKYVKTLHKSFGFSAKYYSIKWRFKTNYQGDKESSYENQPESIPQLSQELLNNLKDDLTAK